MRYRYELSAALVLGVAVFTTCTSKRIRTDFDPQARFSDMATYNWVEPGATSYDEDASLLSPWMSRHVQSAADEALLSRGYHPAAAADADFRIAYRVAADAETRVAPNYGFGYSYGHGYGHHGFGHRFGHHGFGHSRFGRSHFGRGFRGFGSYYDPYHVRHDLRVTLVLEIFDAEADQLVWRGSASDLLDVDPEPGEVREFLSEAVEGILKEFPPRREAEGDARMVAP